MPSPQWINTISSYQDADVTTLACGPQSHVTGNLLVAIVSFKTIDAKMLGAVTDTAGNTYAVVSGSQANDAATEVQLWWALNSVGHPSNVVTADFLDPTGSFPDVVANPRMIVLQYANVLNGSPRDDIQVGQTIAATTHPTNTPVTTTAANDLLVTAACSTMLAVWSADAGSTLRAQAGGNTAVQDKGVGAAGPYTAQLTTNVAVDGAIAAAAFKYSTTPFDHGAGRQGIDAGSPH